MDSSQFNTTGYCKDCYREYHRMWTAQSMPTTEELKAQVMTHYGSKCVQCGEADLTVLRMVPPGSRGVMLLLQAIRRENYPDRYQIMCANCWIRSKD